MKKIKTFYLNLKIKYKMFLLITVILTAFSVGGISILQYAFHVYNDEYYRQSAQSLNVSSISIENELKKMERLSYQVATDLSIQNYLFELKRSSSDFDQFLIGSKLRKRILELGALNKYVNSIQVYDWQDVEYKVGNRMAIIPTKRLEAITEKARAKEGTAEWISPIDNDPSLIVARDVRYYITLSMEQLGIVVVRFDIEQMVADAVGDLNEAHGKFVIMDEKNELVYPMDNALPLSNMVKKMKGKKGYSLLSVDNDQYFFTYRPAQYTDWTYIIISPYSSLFKAITTVRKAVIATYTILFLFILYFGIRFVSNITRPIESLNRKMKRVQTGEFNLSGEEYEVTFAKDELGEMHQNFQMMMDQINTLIKENYQKQIAIKDSEFKTLQAQINPHFLYNTLDSINWAAKVSGQKKVSEIAEALGFLMRTSIETKEPLISIEEELRIVNSYITIQSYRFEERLNFQMDIPDKILRCKIPKFVLQPLVENSIQYGLQQMIGVCKIKVSGKILDSQIVLTVDDNGPGMDEQFLNKLETETYETKGTGLGLKNIRERIKLLFGESYGMKIESKKRKGTKVHIFIPYDEEG